MNFGREGTIGKVTPDGRGDLFVALGGKSVGNGIVFDGAGRMYVADYVGHNVLRIDPKTKAVEVFAHAAMNQPNDLAIAPDGTLYASDPDWARGRGQVWKVSTAGHGSSPRRVKADRARATTLPTVTARSSAPSWSMWEVPRRGR